MDTNQVGLEAKVYLSEIMERRQRHERFQAAQPEGLRKARSAVEAKAAAANKKLWSMVNGHESWNNQAIGPLVIVGRDTSTASGPFCKLGRIISSEAFATVQFGLVMDDSKIEDGEYITGRMLSGGDFRGYGILGDGESTKGIDTFDTVRTAQEVLLRYARLTSIRQSIGLIIEAARDEELNPRVLPESLE